MGGGGGGEAGGGAVDQVARGVERGDCCGQVGAANWGASYPLQVNVELPTDIVSKPTNRNGPR